MEVTISKNQNKTKFIISILILSLAMILFAGTASAANIYVATNGSDTNNGTSWAFAKQSIKNATGTANSGDTVNIADGIYNGTGSRNITITKHMTITGQSKEGTIIDAERQDRIFIISSEVTVILRNLTLTNGNVTGDRVTGSGGAIYNDEDGDLTVTDSTFTNNTADEAGGAIENLGTMNLSNSTFTGNTAGYIGGAIYTCEILNVTGSTFSGNSATGDPESAGGAIFNIAGNLTVTGSNFTNNTAGGRGGGAIFNAEGDATISNSTFMGNISSRGGAIYSEEDNLTITNSIFTGNNATNYGGAIYNASNSTVTNSTFTGNTARYAGAIYNRGALNLTNTTFTGNNATNRGGAIYHIIGTLNVINSTFKGNIAGIMGGAINNNANLTVTGSTFTGNRAGGFGGAISNDGGNSTIHFSRIVGNTAPQGSAIYSSSGSVNATHNWWGSNANPGSKVSGNVTVGPWMVLTIKVNPTSISSTGKSTITVNLLHDSNGVYHDPKDGHVPDGLPVTYTATKGTINPTSNTLINLSSTSTFKAGNPGIATVTATVDNQTVPAQITIGYTKTTVTPVSGYATQNITLKATITGSTINEGQVRFKVGNVTAGTAKVKNGVATLNWKAPLSWKPNTYTITAYYRGTTKYMATNGTGTFTLKPFPNLSFWQSLSKGTHYYGDTIHYYITLKNHDPETLSFSIYDKLPSGLKYVSSKATKGSYKLSTSTWNTGTLKPGQTAKLDIKAKVIKVGWITVKSTLTMSTWKGPIGIMTNSFDVSKAVPYSELLKASKDIEKYYETHNNRLPGSLKVAGQTLTMPQLLKLFTTATINFNKKNTKPISVTTVGKAPYPGGIYASGKLYNYLTVAKNIKTFIDKKGRAPNYAQTRLGTIPFSKLVYMYAKVVNFYGQNKRLPRYVATYKI